MAILGRSEPSGEDQDRTRGNFRIVGKSMTSAASVLIAGLIAASGCSMMFIGHRIDLSKVDRIVVGETTRAEIEAMFGKPFSSAKKHGENISVIVYKYARTLGLGIPFVLSVGRTSVKGHQLTIAISDDTDKVLNYEVTGIDDPFF